MFCPSHRISLLIFTTNASDNEKCVLIWTMLLLSFHIPFGVSASPKRHFRMLIFWHFRCRTGSVLGVKFGIINHLAYKNQGCLFICEGDCHGYTHKKKKFSRKFIPPSYSTTVGVYPYKRSFFSFSSFVVLSDSISTLQVVCVAWFSYLSWCWNIPEKEFNEDNSFLYLMWKKSTACHWCGNIPTNRMFTCSIHDTK